jgi:hypothetical protein
LYRDDNAPLSYTEDPVGELPRKTGRSDGKYVRKEGVVPCR